MDKELALLNRRHLMQALFTVSVLPLTSACTELQKPLVVGSNNFTGYDFFRLAKDDQLYDVNKIQMITLPSATHVTHALTSNTIDLALLTLDEALRIMQEGFPLQVIAVLDISRGVDAVFSPPGFSLDSDWRGKRIGTDTSATGLVVLRYFLKRLGLQDSDVKIVYANYAAHFDLAKSNELDAIISFSPESNKVETLGWTSIYSSADFEPSIVDVVVGNKGFLQENSKIVSSFLQGHFFEVEQLRISPDKITARLSELSGLTKAEVSSVLEGLNFLDVQQNHAWLSNGFLPMQAALQRLAAVLNIIVPAPSDFCVDKYLP